MMIMIPSPLLTIEPKWRIGSLLGVSVDFADQFIYGTFTGEPREQRIFDLRSYGISLDNRYCDYRTSIGKAGVFIELLTSQDKTFYSTPE